MNDAVFSGLDSEGKIVFQLVAARIEGSEDSSLLNLSDVEINYAEDLDVPWLITAASAVSARDQDFLELHDVVLQRTADSPNERARIEATDIRLEPDTQIARTSGPVRFAIGTSSIEAVGLTADLRAERFRLESGVNARIAP